MGQCNNRPIVNISSSFQKVSFTLQETNKLNIATLQPHYSDPQFNSTVIDNAAQKVVNANSNYIFSTNLDNEDVTIEAIKNLSNNKIIILNSHGFRDPVDGQYGFELGIKRNNDLDKEYRDDLTSVPQRRLIWSASGSYIVTTAFFEKHWDDNSFDNTLMYLGTCHGADGYNFVHLMERKGIKTILAFENSVFSQYDIDMCETVFDELIKKNDNGSFYTVGQAVEYAKNKHGDDDSNFRDRANAYFATFCSVFLFGVDTGYEHLSPAKLKICGDEDWALDKEYAKTGTIMGVVLDADTNISLADVMITVYDEGKTISITKKTNAIGMFAFDFPEGTCFLDFSLENDDYKYFPITIETEVSYNEVTDLGNIFLSLESIKPPSGDDGTTNWDFIVPVTHLTEQEAIAAGYTLIYTPQDLENIRYNPTAKCILMNDIDLSDFGNWTPIGRNNSVSFSGTFNGNGFTIRNLSIVGSYYSPNNPVGLFGYGANAIIKNVGLIDTNIRAYAQNGIGALIGSANGITIDNCYTTGIVVGYPGANSASVVGGIIGRIIRENPANISNCYNKAELQASISGGIIAYTPDINIDTHYDVFVSNCYNYGTVLGEEGYAGGIIGGGLCENSKIVITDCHNYGQVTGTSSVGGIIGSSVMGSSDIISNCSNKGKICGDLDYSNVGGIIGYASETKVEKCYNTGYVQGKRNVGGIVGSGAGTIDKCYNTGKIFSEGTYLYTGVYAGGIIGIGNYNISDCYNLGTITIASGTSFAGGIAGGIAGYSSLKNCYNAGVVSVVNAKTYGGLIATVSGVSTFTINSSYYSNEINLAIGQRGACEVISNNVAALSELQMKQQLSYAGFDFGAVWAIDQNKNDGFPYLRSLEP